MTGILVCVSAAVMGVDYGWQPVGGGGIEYIIQIEPELVDSLKSGRDVFSDLPSSVQNIRSYRITVGRERLPHQGEPPPTSAVVPAGGTSAAAENRRPGRGKSAPEIDLSQLPGPILGPALMMPEKDGADEEPQHIAEEEVEEPARNQIAGYHEAREQQDDAVERAKPMSSGTAKNDQTNSKSPATAGNKNESAVKRAAESAEPESPSDRNPEKPSDSRVRPELVQLGLFTSLCCNVFLLWVTTGQRSRYRALVRRMFDGIGNDAVSQDRALPVLPRWEPLAQAEEQGASGKPGNAAE